jgi:hypothetical protein
MDKDEQQQKYPGDAHQKLTAYGPENKLTHILSIKGFDLSSLTCKNN